MKKIILLILLALATTVNSAVVGVVSNPVGSVITFASATCPPGYLSTDGSSYLKTLYPNLFLVIGVSHGSADSTHFNIPDYRGTILRMIDGSKGNDPDKLTRTAMNTGGATGNSIGSVQSDSLQGHAHGIYMSSTTAINANGQPAGWSINNAGTGTTNTLVTDGVNGAPRTGLETRPKNAYINYCIKY